MSAAADPVVVRGRPTRLPVLSATASGQTALAAFHRALMTLDIGRYNLVRLSSVIPPEVPVVPGSRAVVDGGWGDRLYCVYAEQRTSTPGEEAWACVGWVQRLDGLGGWLVEHEGASEGYVTQAVQHSLEDMVADSEHEFTPPQSVVTGVRCEHAPVCALVVVPFATVPWGT
jgi:arginine decarboxylase